MRQKISTFPLRLPISLKNAVAEYSREDNTSINQFVVVAVAEKLSAMKSAEFFAERRRRADWGGGKGHSLPRGRTTARARGPPAGRLATFLTGPGLAAGRGLGRRRLRGWRGGRPLPS